MIIAILAVLGLIYGDFVTACVWRLHEQGAGLEEPPKASRAKKASGTGAKDKHAAAAAKAKGAHSARGKADLSILKGRSVCEHCYHQLTFVDMIPVLGWLSLRGRCRYCRHAIPWEFPLIELAMAAIFVLSYLYWPEPFTAQGIAHFAAWLAIAVGLMILFVYDLKWMILPNRVVYPLVGIAAAVLLADIVFFKGGLHSLQQGGLGLLAAAVPFFLIYELSRGRWIGGGDVKLGLLIGLVMQSFMGGLLVIFLASLAGTAFIIPGMLARRITPRSRIAFGPFLIIAFVVARMFGGAFITWYQHQVLLMP